MKSLTLKSIMLSSCMVLSFSVKGQEIINDCPINSPCLFPSGSGSIQIGDMIFSDWSFSSLIFDTRGNILGEAVTENDILITGISDDPFGLQFTISNWQTEEVDTFETQILLASIVYTVTPAANFEISGTSLSLVNFDDTTPGGRASTITITQTAGPLILAVSGDSLTDSRTYNPSQASLLLNTGIGIFSLSDLGSTEFITFNQRFMQINTSLPSATASLSFFTGLMMLLGIRPLRLFRAMKSSSIAIV